MKSGLAAFIADVNVLFSILVREHASHPTAWRWWSDLADDSVWLVPLVRLGVLRLLSSTVVMSRRPLPPTQALDAWSRLAEDPRCYELPLVELPDEKIFRDCVAGRTGSPNLWTDAWLAALARTFDEEVVTFDQGFRTFTGL